MGRLEVVAHLRNLDGREMPGEVVVELDPPGNPPSHGGGDPFEDRFLRDLEACAALGIEQVWLTASRPDPAGWVTRVCDEVLPRIRDL